MREYSIHGDNVVECERTLSLIARGLGADAESFLHSGGSACAPRFEHAERRLAFTLYPGFSRWDQDILAAISTRGGSLREAPDALVTSDSRGRHEIRIAIEYCGALPAGNQAWQRQGRAYSLAQAGVPYLYIGELSGFELTASRQRKAERLPNPAVPFSFISQSAYASAPCLPVYVPNAGAGPGAFERYGEVFGGEELCRLLVQAIDGELDSATLSSLEDKALALASLRASEARANDTLSPSQWSEAGAWVRQGRGLVSYLLSQPRLRWKKTAYIDALTATASRLMAGASDLARGLTSTKLPMCLIEAENRPAFARLCRELYPGVRQPFLDWIEGEGPLAISWVMGFKPRGDDARPDRGLTPLTRMLVGPEVDVLSVVYGPAPGATWPRLLDDPLGLMTRNGLWQAVLQCSDAVLADCATQENGAVAVITRDLIPEQPGAHFDPPLADVTPLRFSENDVDTVLHHLFTRSFAGHSFEGMCNPPGGDWSGISLLSVDQRTEYRWLGLPRVTSAGAKRPDHVFQLFGAMDERGLAVIVESKETARSVEPGIGPRLIRYLRDLASSTPSVEREAGRDRWAHSDADVTLERADCVSAAAWVISDRSELSAVAAKGEVDVTCGVRFEGRSARVFLAGHSTLGERVVDFIRAHARPGEHISISS